MTDVTDKTLADVIAKQHHITAESGASRQVLTTRRTLLTGLGAFVGLGSASISRSQSFMPGHNQKGFLLSEYSLCGREPRAEAIAALFVALGFDNQYDFGTPRDACRMIMAADIMLSAADMSKDGFGIWEHYGLENRVILVQELANLIAEQDEIHHESTGWTAKHIVQVLETADRLIIEQYLRDTDAPSLNTIVTGTDK